MDQDVIVVGGSFAGLSAAMQLSRARKKVLVLDTGMPRNRFTHASHGFPGQDGNSPQAIQTALRAELAVYPSVSFRKDAAVSIAFEGGGFRVSLADGTALTARRVILAYGVSDTLPDLPGLRERWGVSVLHCPYCHGYELDRQAMGVLLRDETALHQAIMLPEWGPTTVFTQGAFKPSDDQVRQLTSRGIKIEETPITELNGAGVTLENVGLADGRNVPLAGLFVAPQTAPACDIAEQLGCAVNDGPTGPYLAVDAMQASSVPGVFAAGDLASPMPNATRAAAAGVMAGVAAHRSLIFDPDLIPAA
ncbi:NAD(P)/FAD-dependent oxidoreductase [Notoacmeibacter sp. MSK16QG-6]|uniref:NAD(P)/FAD-dependent oxidoreductase n=1 Tax=Notoacmeibacter sp. MSK16QG-6 TaxID=2957982 RepID=UPI00209D04F4|nr:NAD(P)/FAD-dependent oxidoreductase [Notoacmeibacter sp. MSK16QG-6]MCP1199043.1 NAD(P)/FAD-dependent oxidoreductase [Notoacmeibacter sp. MSK16QG-6]